MTASSENFGVVTGQQDGVEIIINVKDFGGSGPVALLHHANGFSAGTWAFVAEQLVPWFRVFAIDGRGHGESDDAGAIDGKDLGCFVHDEIVVAQVLCEKLGVSQIAYGIGSSFGGVVTALAESRQPGLFQRIALLDPPIIPGPAVYTALGLEVPPANARKGPPIEQTKKRRAHFESLSEARNSWRHKGMFASWPAAAFELYLAECLRPAPAGGVELKCSPLVEANVFESTEKLNVLEYAPLVQAPVLMARATRGLFPALYYQRLAGLFPAGVFEEIEGGHLLPLEAPDAVVASLLAFASVTPG